MKFIRSGPLLLAGSLRGDGQPLSPHLHYPAANQRNSNPQRERKPFADVSQHTLIRATFARVNFYHSFLEICILCCVALRRILFERRLVKRSLRVGRLSSSSSVNTELGMMIKMLMEEACSTKGKHTHHTRRLSRPVIIQHTAPRTRSHIVRKMKLGLVTSNRVCRASKGTFCAPAQK